MTILESIQYLIKKALASGGYNLNAQQVIRILHLTKFEEFEAILISSLDTGSSNAQNTFDLIQYIGDCLQLDFDTVDVRHKATALMCHMYDHCFGTNGLYGTDVLDLLVLQSYYILIDDEQFLSEWLILTNLMIKAIQDFNYTIIYPDNFSEQLLTRIRTNFQIHEFPIIDCHGMDFDFFGNFNCVNSTELLRLQDFFGEYYPGLEVGLMIY